MIWLDFAVCPKFSWPNVNVEIPFEGYKLVLQPRRHGDYGELACTVSVFDPHGITFEVGCTVVSRFLSRISWSFGDGVIELWPAGTNNPSGPGRLGQGAYERSCWGQVVPWDFLYLPRAASDNADLALGLYREGMSVNSTPFAFLSNFKVLNILHAGGREQKNWINSNLQYVSDSHAKERIDELRTTVTDIGKYLYDEGRCAIAHAHGFPLVNPDSYSDKFRMERDLRLIKSIAALFIERELGVLSPCSFRESLHDAKSAGTELLQKVVDAEGKVSYVGWTQHCS